MASQTTATFEKWAKEVFPFRDMYWKQYEQGTPALDLIDRTNSIPYFGKMEGRYIVIPVETATGANDAVPISETGPLPTESAETIDRLKYNVASHASAIKLSGLVMDTMTGGDKSVQDALNFSMKKRPASFRKQLNRLIHGDGSGMLAECVSGSGNTLVVDDAQYLVPGTEVCIYDKDDSTTIAPGITEDLALVVDTQNTTTNTVTLLYENGTTPSFSASPGSAYGVYPFQSQGQAINGFGIICTDQDPNNWGSSTGYFGTVSRASNTWWKGNRYNAADSSGNTSVFDLYAHLQPAIDQVEKRAQEFLSAKSPNDGDVQSVRWYAFTGRQNFRSIGNQLSQDIRTDGRPKKLTGGWTGIDYEGCVFVVDNDAPASKIRMVHFPSVKRYMMREPYWDDREGSIWRRVSHSATGRDSDVFKAYMLARLQMISCQSLTHLEIYNTSATS